MHVTRERRGQGVQGRNDNCTQLDFAAMCSRRSCQRLGPCKGWSIIITMLVLSAEKMLEMGGSKSCRSVFCPYLFLPGCLNGSLASPVGGEFRLMFSGCDVLVSWHAAVPMARSVQMCTHGLDSLPLCRPGVCVCVCARARARACMRALTKVES